MLNLDKIKAIKKILPKKSFNPIFNDLIYCSEYDTFIASDTFTLLEIKNPFGKFDFDFCIPWETIRNIKDSILTMTIEWNYVKLTWNKDNLICEYTKDIKVPDYKILLDKKETTINSMIVTKQYETFFWVCSMLWNSEVVFLEDGYMKTKNDDVLILQRMRQY